MINILLKNNILLFLIVLIGSVLRIYNITNLHLSNDELSALSRTNFNTFSDLINIGVKPDGHPALIQVFLYFYTKLFGTNDFVIKIPFILMSVASIIISFFVAKQFFNKTTGYLTASILSIVQLSVMYGQIARPYASGLFFILFAIYFWQKLIKNNFKYKYILGYIVFMVLSSYNHYFSLLMALIIGVLGLFFIKKEFLVKYMLSNLLVILLFTPHLLISIYQFNIGGLGWLPEPDIDFLIRYFGYIFNYCWLLFIFSFGILIYGIITNKKQNIKYIVLNALFLLLPLLFGYFYSVYVAPILQFSVLIFSMPFFFILLFSTIKEQSELKNYIFSFVIIVLGVYSLTVERQHYKYAYDNKFYNTALNTKEDILLFKKENIGFVFIANNRFYVNKYLVDNKVDTNNINISFFNDDNLNIRKFKQVVYKSQTEYFAFGCLITEADFIFIDIIKEKYPYLIKITDHYFLFSKNEKKLIKESNVLDTIYTKEIKIEPNLNNERVHFDSINKQYYFDYNKSEWGADLTFGLDTILNNRNNILIISAKVKVSDFNDDVSLASDISLNDSNVYWADRNIQEFIINNDSMMYLYRLDLLQNIETKNCKSKVYLWNKSKNSLRLYSLKYTIIKGFENPYGLFWNLDEN